MRWKVGWHDLENGIRVYYFYDSGGTTHICNVGFKVGSVHDLPGMAHLAEHILFRGRKSGPEDPVYNMIYRYFGGMERHNIFTSYAITNYGGLGLYRRSHMREVMPVIVDVLKDRFISREGISIEKAVINNEFRQHDLDKPESQLGELFLQTTYETNPIRRPVIGEMSELRKFTPRMIRQFIQKYYVALNMFTLVFGPKKEESLAIAREYLDDWPYVGQPPVLDLKSFDKVPKFTKPRITETGRVGLAQHYVMTGFPTGCYNSKNDAALDIIEMIVERRLYDILREKSSRFTEGTYHHPTFTDRSLVHGTIGAWFATASLDFAKYGRDAIVKEFVRLTEEAVSWDLFDSFRDSAREKFLSSFRDTPEQVADMVIQSAANGDSDLEHLHSYTERLNRLKPSVLREVAKKYFDPNSFASVIISPA